MRLMLGFQSGSVFSPCVQVSQAFASDMADRENLDSPGAYADAGVDIDAGEALVERIKPFAKATARRGAAAALGGFGALFDPKAAGFIDPILVASNDGVGTKVKVAIETGVHNTIGIDLVAMCVNDVVVQGAQPLFFLDYFACSKLDVDIAARVVEGIAEGCKQAGAALIGGETAEMPGIYAAGDYDLAGFSVGAAERGTLLSGSTVAPGDTVIAVASSGVHSNGYSLVRKVVRDAGLSWDAPAPFDRSRSLGMALLEPTRIYVKPALKAHAAKLVKAFAHITGGGLPGNLPRVLPDGCAAILDLSTIEVPPVFSWLAKQGQVAHADMLRTFNCGAGFIVVTAERDAAGTIAIFKECGDDAYIIGAIEKRHGGAAPIRFAGELKFDI